MFQAPITRRSRSKPRTETAAVSSAKLAAVLSREVDPAGGEHAQDVAVGEDGDVAVGGQRAGDHAVGPLARLRHGLAAGRAVGPQRPARALGADLRRRPALVVAVVDLGQVGLDLGRVAGQPRGLARANARRREHERELAARQPLTQRAGGLAAALGERDVGGGGVPAGEAPLRLPVTDQDELHPRAFRASASTASTCRRTGAGPLWSSTTNALPSGSSWFCQPIAVPR